MQNKKFYTLGRRSTLKGRCFNLKPLIADTAEYIMLGVRKSGLKLILYFHDDGDELWLKVGNFPYHVAFAVVDTSEDYDVSGFWIVHSCYVLRSLVSIRKESI